MYTLFTLPHGFDYENLTRKQAKENLLAMVDRIPERLRMLQKIVNLELPQWRADLSDKSLSPLGEWYARHIEERTVSEQELAEYRAKMGIRWEFLAEVRVELTKESYSYGIDIGIYVGECIRSRCPNAKWAVAPGSKSYINYNMPALVGFGLYEYTPMSAITSHGIHIVRARKLVRNQSGEPPVTPGEQLAAGIAAIPVPDPSTMLIKKVAAFQECAT